MSVFKRTLTGQAEQINTYEAYKKLITKIIEMDYEELYDLMSETETILKVLCREDSSVHGAEGLLGLTSKILKLGATFLEANDYPLPFEVKAIVVPVNKPYTGYTYESIERKEKKQEERAE